MAVLVALTASLALAQETAAKTEAPAKDAEKAPRLTVVEPVKDYGIVAKGAKLNWTFAIKNTGTSDLQIIAARPACGCTVAEFDKVVKPGETGKVTAEVDTTTFNGPIAKSVTLETNDPVTPTAQLTIHATVKPYVEAYPAGFVRYVILQGDAEMQSITLYSEEAEPFEITKVEVPGDYVKVAYTKITNDAERAPNVGTPGQAQYKVNITVGGPDAKVGPLAEKIRIFTNSKHQPEYPVSITGVIRPPFRVEPTVMNFGEVAPSDVAASRAIVIRSNDLKTPERLQVTKAESSSPMITTSVKAGANKGEYEVTLQVAKNAKPGDVEGTVTIYTNDQVNPVVTVPVKATVKAAPKAAASK
ncbi:MAG: DUF1573 domain-containing protein [Acidobacteriota bacterium]